MNFLQKLSNWRERPKKALVVLVIALFVAVFLWGRTADAAEARLGIGFGYASNEGATYQELMLTSDDLRWYGAVTRIGGDTRNNYHYTRFTAGYRVNWRRETNFSPFMRLGAAYFDKEPTDYISDDLAFDMAIGVRLYDIVELEIDQHNSTGGRSDQNEGLDGFMLGLTFPFGK